MLAPVRSIDEFTLRNLRQNYAECPSVSAGQVENILFDKACGTDVLTAFKSDSLLRPVPLEIQGERAGSLAVAEARTRVVQGERAGSLASVLACDPNFSTWSYLRVCFHLLFL